MEEWKCRCLVRRIKGRKIVKIPEMKIRKEKRKKNVSKGGNIFLNNLA